MSYRQKYFEMAEKELENRRDANKRKWAERIAQAEKKIPELSQLRRQLAANGMAVGKLAFSGEKNIKEKVAQLAARNMELQHRIRELLVKNGFSGNELEPIYTCEKCQDTGIYKNMRCECFLNEVKRFESGEMNARSSMDLCSFASFYLSMYSDTSENAEEKSPRENMKENYEYCVKYCEDFHLPYSGILMQGNTGLGKTHLSLSIANAVIQKGYSVIYVSAPDIMRQIEKEHFNAKYATDSAEQVIETDLLILDDVGAEFESRFNASVLYNILNSRINSGHPTIISTNLDPAELQTRYGDRIASRMFTMHLLDFYGDDIRIKKSIEGS